MVRSPDSSRPIVLIAVVLAIGALYFGRQLLIPMALGLVFSFVLTPFVTQLERLRLGRAVAVFVVLILSFALAGSLSWRVAGQLVEVMAHLADYKYNLDTKIHSFRAERTGNLSKATATVKELNKELGAVPGQLAANQARAKEPGSKELGSKGPGSTESLRPIPVQVALPPSNILQDLGTFLGPLAGVLETAVIVIIFTIFMLLKREDLRDRAIRLAGRGRLSVMTQALDDAGRRLSRYLLLQFVVNAGYGLLFGTGLYFIGIPHAFLWGALSGVLRFVPYIGTYTAAAFPILMAIAVFPGWRHAGLAFGIFVVLEILISNFVEPVLYGTHTGISSLAILVAAIFWTTLWGPVGLILSTPLTVCLVVLGRYVPQLSFLEVVLGDEPVLTPAQRFYQRLLATDQEEAREIVLEHLKENSLESVYEEILIPALRLTEQDHHLNGLDDDIRRFVFRSTKELVEELGDRVEDGSFDGSFTGMAKSSGEAVLPLSPGAQKRIVCVASRTGADDLIVQMLAQLLRRAQYQVRELKAQTEEDVSSLVSQNESDTVVISSLLPFAIAETRVLCRRLHANDNDVRVIVGLWDFEGGAEKGRERMGPNCHGVVTTTLSETLAEIQKTGDAEAAPAASAESSAEASHESSDENSDSGEPKKILAS